jgi:hypothetical protein
VHRAAIDRERIVRELALGPLEVEETLAIERLVDHAGGDEIGRRAGQWESAREGFGAG